MRAPVSVKTHSSWNIIRQPWEINRQESTPIHSTVCDYESPQSQLSNSSRGDCTPASSLARRDFRSPDSVSACCLEKLSASSVPFSTLMTQHSQCIQVWEEQIRRWKYSERIKEIERKGREEGGRKKEGKGGERKEGNNGGRKEGGDGGNHASALPSGGYHP